MTNHQLPPPPHAAPPPLAPEPVVSLQRVSKAFKGVVAVSDVSFNIGPGVTALLGPNGAGKSTVLRMVCGLAQPSGGAVRVFGKDPRKETEVLAFVGLVPQQDGTFAQLRALDFVTMAAKLNRVENAKEIAADSLQSVDLEPSDQRAVSSYSKGMKQRVKVAQALVTNPALVIADEPLNGLDPRQRARLIEVFQGLGAQGRTVLISSHVLDEVERFGSKVLVIAEGRLAAEGDFRQIRGLMDSRPHLIRVRSDNPRVLAAGLISSPAVLACKVTDAVTVELEIADVRSFRHWIAPLAKHYNVSLHEVMPLDDDLESVFRYLVGAGPAQGHQ